MKIKSIRVIKYIDETHNIMVNLNKENMPFLLVEINDKYFYIPNITALDFNNEDTYISLRKILKEDRKSEFLFNKKKVMCNYRLDTTNSENLCYPMWVMLKAKDHLEVMEIIGGAS